MESKLIYLGGPIASLGDKKARYWRRKLGVDLNALGISSFDPANGFNVNPKHVNLIRHSIQPINDAAIRASDLVIIAYNNVPSVGTDYEIELARNLGKPVFVLSFAVRGFNAWYSDRFLGGELDRHKIAKSVREGVYGQRLGWWLCKEDYPITLESISKASTRGIKNHP